MTNRTVRMLVKISGSRDGVDWPARGEEIEVPANEAEDLIRNHYAESTDEAPKEEHATADTKQVETAVGNKPVRTSRKSGLTKADMENPD